MSQKLHSFACPSCTFNYSNIDSSRSNSRFPLLLNCGHTTCEACIKLAFRNHGSISCSVCQKSTPFKDGHDIAKLPPDVFVLGVISANARQDLKMDYLKFSSPSEKKVVPETIVTCEHCSKKEASYRCEKCVINFCNECFDVFHQSKSKLLRNHVGVPVFASNYISMVQEGCAEHDNRAIEFYCELDNELTCSLCVVTGKHKGHPVLTLVDKNKSCSDELKAGHEEAINMQKRLKFTEQKLSQSLPTEKYDSSQYVKQIHNHFHELHSALSMRENELLSQLQEISMQSSIGIKKMRQEISDYWKDLDALLHDTHRVIENPTLSVSAPTLIMKLKQSKLLPCHLISVPETEESESVCLDFSEDLVGAIKKDGKISADIKPRFYLRSCDEIPEDFVIEPLPIEPCIPIGAGTDSIVSDSFSEDSLGCDTKSIASTSLKFQHPARLEKVCVSYVASPTDFWLYRSSDKPKLFNLATKINQWCNTQQAKKQMPKSIKLGDIYLVLFESDKKWYRGRVLDTVEVLDKKSPSEPLSPTKTGGSPRKSKFKQEEVLYKVLYVDFGNTEVVPIDSIRNMQLQFLSWPGMVRHCALYNITPLNGETWTAEAIQLFCTIVGNKEVNMQIVEERNNIFYVDLSQAFTAGIINDVPVSVREALIFMGHGCMFFSDQAKAAVKRKTKPREYLPTEHLRATVRVPVLLSHIESPSLFYAQQISTNRHLSSLIFDMNKTYEKEIPTHKVYVPYVGMMCAAQYEKDKIWYRGIVLNVLEEGKVEVQYVDFGNKEVLHFQFLAHLEDKFTKLQAQAIPCTLADVSYGQEKMWQPQATKWLKDYTQTLKSITLLSLGMMPGDKITKTVLYDLQETQEVNINALMVQEKMAFSCGPYSEVVSKPRKPAAKGVASSPKQQGNHHVNGHGYSPPKKVDTRSERIEEAADVCDDEPNYVRVHMSYIESPSLFYIRIADKMEDLLISLMNQLQQDYADSEPDEELKICQGVTYAALRQMDNKWYRAVVQEELDANSFKVCFLDYGFVETAPKHNIRVLHDRFAKDETFSMQCHLSGILPAGGSNKWPNIAIEKFHELVAPHEVMYLTGEVEEDSGDRKTLPVDILSREVVTGGALEPVYTKYNSITQQLIVTGLALKIRRKSMPRVSEAISIPSPSPILSAIPVTVTPIVPELILPSKDHLFPAPPPVRKLFKWKPPVLPTKETFTAIATHIDYDGSIYLQEKPIGTDRANMINSALMFKYNEELGDLQRSQEEPEIGEAVAAKFLNDMKWYRAEVLNVYPGRIKVLFVDYGNCEIVSLDDIQFEPPTRDIPRQAFPCVLHGVKPVDSKVWQKSVLDFLHERIVEQDCYIHIKAKDENGKPEVMISRKEGNIDIAQELVQIDFAKYITDDTSLSEESSDDDDDFDVLEHSRDIGTDVSNWPKRCAFRVSVPFEVIITEMLKPGLVFFQRLPVKNPECEEDVKLNEEHDKFVEMNEALQERAEDFEMIDKPEVGLPYCAQFSFDNNWYRCEVIEIVIEGVRVLYVDYGNSEVVPVSKLRNLDPYFLEFPPCAQLAKIRGVELTEEECSPETCRRMAQMLVNPDGKLFAKIMVPGELPEIELFLKSEDEDMKFVF